MNDNLKYEMQEIANLLNNDKIAELYNREYEHIDKIKKRKEDIQKDIQNIKNCTSSIDNYKNNLEVVVSYYKQIQLQLNNSFIIYDNETNKIDFELKTLIIKQDKCKSSLQEYNNLLSNIENEEKQITTYVKNFPKNKDFFAQYKKNIEIQSNFLNHQIENTQKEIDNLSKQIKLLQNKKDERLQKKENIQSYVNDMIKNPEKSNLSIDINGYNKDKSSLERLTRNLNELNKYRTSIDYDAQKEFNKLYNNYLDGKLNNEELKKELEKYKDKINKDNLILQKEPKILDELNQKLDTLLTKVKDLVVEEKKGKQDDVSKEDSEEIVDIKPAKKRTIDKLKVKKKKITAFCLATLFAINIGAVSKFFNNKNNDINNLNNNVSSSDQTIDDGLFVPNIDIDFKEVQSKYSVPNTIEIKEGSHIYENSYDAINDNNAMKPYFGYDQEKDVCGVTIEMPDGNIKTIYKDSKDFFNDYYNLMDAGGTVKLYLTEHNNEYEGFYRADDSISTGMRR